MQKTTTPLTAFQSVMNVDSIFFSHQRSQFIHFRLQPSFSPLRQNDICRGCCQSSGSAIFSFSSGQSNISQLKHWLRQIEDCLTLIREMERAIFTGTKNNFSFDSESRFVRRRYLSRQWGRGLTPNILVLSSYDKFTFVSFACEFKLHTQVECALHSYLCLIYSWFTQLSFPGLFKTGNHTETAMHSAAVQLTDLWFGVLFLLTSGREDQHSSVGQQILSEG